MLVAGQANEDDMRRKPYPIAQLTGGLNVNANAVFLTDVQSPNLSMVRFDKGLIKKDLGFANFGTGERVLNGDMEYDGDWANVGAPTNNEQSNAQANSGSYSRLLVSANSNDRMRSQPFPMVAGATYTLTASYYCQTANSSIWVRVSSGNGNTASYANFTSSLMMANIGANVNTWITSSANFVADANSGGNNAYVVIQATNASCVWYVDDVSLTRSNPTDERIMHFDNLYLSDGTEYLVCFTPTRMYVYDSGVWEPAAGSRLFTGDLDDQFSTVSFENLLIITNGQDTVKKWDGTTMAALGDLSTISLTAAKVVTAYNSRLILGNTVEGATACPYRVRWSATGEEEHWDPSTYPDAGFVDLIDTPDWITGFATLVDRLFVFKERSIWELLPTRDLQVFETRLVIDGIGTYSESTIVSLGDVLIFFGTDDVYLFDGATLKSVGENIFPWFYTTGEKKVNASYLNRTASVYVEELGDYILCLPTIGDDPDWMVRYNVNEEHWTQRDKSATSFGFYSQVDMTDWSEATGYWDNSQWDVDWSSKLLPPGAPITLIGRSDGLIEKDDRLQTSSELMTWETKDFVFGHSERVVAISVKCKGNGDFTIWYSTDQGRTWADSKTLTPDSSDFKTEKWYLNVTCDQIRFRVTTQATSFDIMWIEPWYIDRSRTTSPSVS